MCENYTTSGSSVPNTDNEQFQVIKGLGGVLICLIVGIAAIMLKYVKTNMKKFLESSDSEKGVKAEIAKLQEQLEMLSYAQRQNKTSFPLKNYGSYSHLCSSSHKMEEDERTHNAIDADKMNGDSDNSTVLKVYK